MLKVCAAVVSVLFSTQYALANVIGSDAQNFNPTTNGLDFVTVQSSETLEPGILNLGLFFNYALNTLPYFPAAGGGLSQSRSDFNDSFTSGDFNFGIGLFKNFDMGLSFPVLIDQSVDNTGGLGLYKEGMTEIRLNLKYRVYGDADHGVAFIATFNQNQIKNNPFAGQDAGVTSNLEVAADTTLGKWVVGGNLGYRWREPGTPVTGVNIDPMPDQWIASVASSYYLESWDSKLLLELYSSFPSNSEGTNQTDRDYSSAELLVGIKHDLRTDIAGHLGMGTEVLHGASSPDWRIYTGLNWTLGPLWSSKREVLTPTPQKHRFVLEGLNFKTSTAQLSEGSDSTLEDLRQSLQNILQIQKVTKIVVEGHTDSVGRDEVNLELSQYRADVIKKFIIEKTSLTAEQVEAVGYGETKPIADNGNYQGRAKNRRVEVVVHSEGDKL